MPDARKASEARTQGARVSPAGRAAGFDLVTVDAFGTLIELVEPYDALAAALRACGVSRPREAVAAAFSAEVAYYVPRAHEGRAADSLARLRRDCAAVFLSELEAGLDPDEFAPAFVGAIEFRPTPGAPAALARLRAGGLALSCVANWDISLEQHLARLGLSHFFTTVITAAEVGVPKPEPAIFELALRRAAVEPSRALHIGDGDADREGARRAGMAFTPPPLATLPARLKL